jgi:hypothetical protein
MKTIIALIGIAMMLSAVILANPTESLAQRSGSPAMRGAHMSGVVIGKEIRATSGAVLGKVENIVLTDQGCVRYVVLSGQFPRARGRLFPIPWDQIAMDRDVFLVDVDPVVLLEAPSFTAGRWPDFAQAQWNTRVSEFFRSHVRANAPAGAGAKERLKTREEHKSMEKQSTEKQTPREEKMKAGREMRHEQKSREGPGVQEMKKQVLPGQKQMEMKRQPGATGEQHGINTQRTPERPHEGMMQQQHTLPGTMGHQQTPSVQPGQGGQHQEREIK